MRFRSGIGPGCLTSRGFRRGPAGCRAPAAKRCIHFGLHRATVERFVAALEDSDGVELIAFNIASRTLFGSLKPATAEAKTQAEAFLRATLFVYLACVQLANAWRQGRWRSGLLPAMLLAGFGSKLLYELVTNSALFVDSQASGFVVVVLAHAVGASAGAVLGVARAQPRAAILPGR